MSDKYFKEISIFIKRKLSKNKKGLLLICRYDKELDNDDYNKFHEFTDRFVNKFLVSNRYEDTLIIKQKLISKEKRNIMSEKDEIKIVFTPEEFIKAVEAADRNKTIQFFDCVDYESWLKAKELRNKERREFIERLNREMSMLRRKWGMLTR